MALRRPRPSHFLAFRITNAAIIEKAKNAIKIIQEKFKGLEPQPVVKLHITLGVFHVPQEQDIEKISELMNDWSERRRETIFTTPIVLNFKNYGKFGSNLLFFDIDKCENYKRLTDLATELNEIVRDAGYVGGFFDRPYNPHLTILKQPRNRKEFRDLWEELSSEGEVDFGTQEIESIQFLSMDVKDVDGYYFCRHEISTSPERVLPERKPPARWR